MPRLLRRHAAYAAIATIVLAVSVGVNLLVFTVANALWLRPLPLPEPSRVVTLPHAIYSDPLNAPELRVFEDGVAGQVDSSGRYGGLQPRIEIAGRIPETTGVTSAYFRVLGLTVRGRDFAPADDLDGAEPVAIVSNRLWTRSFGARPEVIGQLLATKPFPMRVIGIAPTNFEGARRGERTEMWIPMGVVRRLTPPDWRGHGLPLMIFGRLGPRQTVAMAQQELEIVAPKVVRLVQTAVTPVGQVFGTPELPTSLIDEGRSLLIVCGLAMMVLLGGCATLAALVLMHYERRRGELALKISLGACRRQLVSEASRDLSWVAAGGSAAGLLVAAIGVHVVPALSLPGGVNIARLDLSIDWRVGALAIVASALALAAAAALPIARSTRLPLAGELLAGLRPGTRSSLRTRQALLALQVCGAIVVLVAAGLFVSSVAHSLTGAAGFDIDKTVFVSIQEGAPYRDPGRDPLEVIRDRDARLTSVLLAAPGVRDVAEGIWPIGRDALALTAKPKALQIRDSEYHLLVGSLSGSPNLLSVLGVPIVLGRALTAADSAGIPRPIVVTQSVAERLWPEGNALGQPVSLPMWSPSENLVVGIARDFAFGSLAGPGAGVIVTVGPGTSSIVSTFVVRTDEPDSLTATLRRTSRGQVVRVATGREVVSQDIGRQRLGAWVFSAFGLAALLLGVGGAFGLVAYLAESQRREFGVRMALGADWRDLVRHGMTAAVLPVAAGVTGGLLLSALASKVLQAYLVGISALDPVAYVAVAVTMLSCGTIAALAAAWRLRRTTPSDALRVV